MEKLKVKTTYVPAETLSQNEWFEQLGVSSAYVKPTQYYQGNDLTFNSAGTSFSFLNLLKNLFVWTN